MEEANASQEDQRRAAFARYVVPEVDVLMRVATSIVRRPADAEDLVQDTLIRAYRAADRFDGAYPRAWLLTILRNAHLSSHRRRRPELLWNPEIDETEEPAEAGDRDNPETIYLNEQFDAEVTRAFAALPERARQIVELVDIDGLSCVEAAELLGIPEGTVMSRLHRARQRMRKRLAATGVAPKARLIPRGEPR
ncbi:MAG: sigma-70 family RNA polymerase sigma factor [Acidimicrobiia bacterium]